ncbi:copper-transporting ATPase HMA5 [Pyrus ussuriensis x Pyrus communis]|uniref:Copper-transporting ATPase HMA5 n=1 Tax=Pyrus ussuriensis x Pyrus communis TaxID=2448454 RepID=A0A5N5GPB1_9ROSA|nr:copper-transporting ATPase HMA5 [Pyrus ussuriensis x Pyrus communis]
MALGSRAGNSPRARSSGLHLHSGLPTLELIHRASGPCSVPCPPSICPRWACSNPSALHLTYGISVLVVAYPRASGLATPGLATPTVANSEHPIAKSVVEHAKRLLKTFGSTKHVMEAKDFEVHTGAGVSGRVGDKMVLAGNKRLMRENNVLIGSEVDMYVSKHENLARMCVLVAIDGKIAGSFAVTDPVKPEETRQECQVLRNVILLWDVLSNFGRILTKYKQWKNDLHKHYELYDDLDTSRRGLP